MRLRESSSLSLVDNVAMISFLFPRKLLGGWVLIWPRKRKWR